MRWGLSSVIFILVVRCILSGKKKQERGERPERKDEKKLSVTAKKGHHLERSCLLGSVGGHVVFYANSATIRCGWFTVSSYLEQPINANQSRWWSSMGGKNSKRRTRTAEILYLNCHLKPIRFETGHRAALKVLGLPSLRLSEIFHYWMCSLRDMVNEHSLRQVCHTRTSYGESRAFLWQPLRFLAHMAVRHSPERSWISNHNKSEASPPLWSGGNRADPEAFPRLSTLTEGSRTARLPTARLPFCEGGKRPWRFNRTGGGGVR